MADPKDLEIVYRDPASLEPYERNSRTHSEAQVRQIRRNMERFGNYNPILLRDDETRIGAGHGRQLAALLKPPMNRVPTITLRGLSDDDWRALIIADNKLAENAGWDPVMLKLELGDLQGAGFDLSFSGFDALELRGIFSTQDGNVDPDEVPDAPAQPVSQAGDVWLLGPHILVCGDCTDPEVVAKALAGQKPHLMVTDPPFGVDYSPEWRTKALKDGGHRAEGAVRNDDRADWREAWALFPGDVAYVWHADKGSSAVEAGLQSCGFETRNLIVWNKSQLVVGRGHYHSKHEAAWYVVRKGANGHWQGSRKEATVWDIEHRRSETGHGTQKPVEAMARPIRNNSEQGDRVYEPFSGSGTTIIAAQMNKRICHAIELESAYVDVGCRRFAEFSGVEPILAETGESWDQVKVRRLEVV